MAKEQFQYSETAELLKHIDEAAHRSRVSRHQAFDDALQMTVCALGRPLMEDEYMEAVARHKEGKPGRRGVDSITVFFSKLVDIMDRTRLDVLGDLFQSSISRGEAGQFLTPEPICEMMCRMQLPSKPTGLEGRKSVNDSCCGSGRMLTAAATIQPDWHFVGQDVDLRCVRMTAISLALRNHYGHVIWGNSLSNQSWRVYETGRVQVWGNAIRNVTLPAAPTVVKQIAQRSTDEEPPSGPTTQLELF